MSERVLLQGSERSSEWVSDCCGAQMSTAGGDGSGMGETCWAVCRACRQPCDPTIYPDQLREEGT